MRQTLILDKNDIQALINGGSLELVTPAGPISLSIDSSVSLKIISTPQMKHNISTGGLTCRFCHHGGWRTKHARMMHEIKTHGWRRSKKV